MSDLAREKSSILKEKHKISSQGTYAKDTFRKKWGKH